MNDERTSMEAEAIVRRPISGLLAKEFSQHILDWCVGYPGGPEVLKKIIANYSPSVVQSFYNWLDDIGSSEMVATPRVVQFSKRYLIGGVSLEELELALLKQGAIQEGGYHSYSTSAERKMLHSDAFKAELDMYIAPEAIQVGTQCVSKLGLERITLDRIFERVAELGYEPLPSIAACQIVLGTRGYSMSVVYIHMKPVIVDDVPLRFKIDANSEDPRLAVYRDPDKGIHESDRVVFRVRP